MDNMKVQALLAELQKEHEKKRELFSQSATKSEKAAQSIQEYTRQKLENQMVLKELELMSSDSTVFKQIGPCLIKQDMFEATSNVKKRIDYISEEVARLEKQKSGFDKEQKDLGDALGKIQRDVQTVMQELRKAESIES
jgi:prefoldin beta subunit